MTYVFYICICIFLVIVRTTVFPMFPALVGCYDLLIPVVIYMGFFRTNRESIPVLLFIGLVMDGLSGVTFGFYLSTYIWLYLIVVWLKQLFLVKNILLLSFATVLGVLMENSMLILMENLFDFRLSDISNIFKTFPKQVILGALTGPFMILFIAYLLKTWNSKLGRLVFRGSGNPDND